MRLEIRRTEDALALEWPVWPRIAPYLAVLLVGCVWPFIGFPIASALALELVGATGLALGPSMLLLVVTAQPLAAELRRERIVLRRVPEGIAVGALAPLRSDAFTLEVRGRGHVYEVRLRARAEAQGRSWDVVLLRHVARSPDEAAVLSNTLREFIGLRSRPREPPA